MVFGGVWLMTTFMQRWYIRFWSWRRTCSGVIKTLYWWCKLLTWKFNFWLYFPIAVAKAFFLLIELRSWVLMKQSCSQCQCFSEYVRFSWSARLCEAWRLTAEDAVYLEFHNQPKIDAIAFPWRRRAIIRTNTGILLIGPLGTNLLKY